MCKLCPICKVPIRLSESHWFGDDLYHLACLWLEYQRLLKLSNRLADEVNMLLNEAELIDPERDVTVAEVAALDAELPDVTLPFGPSDPDDLLRRRAAP